MSETLTHTVVTPPAAIHFNGSALPLTRALTVSDLLASQVVPPEAVATAVNGRFVARELRDTTLLQPGDQVLTFQAIVGG